MKDTSITETRNSNNGYNVMIARNLKGYTQERLGIELNVSTKKICELEKMSVIEDKILDDIAKTLNIDVDFLKNFDPERDVKTYNQTNTFAEDSKDSVNQGHDYTNTNNYYPLSEVMEMTDKLLNMQKEHYEKEMEMLKELGQKDTENTLLKYKLSLSEKK